MKVQIMPLEGKYYGTYVEITTDKGYVYRVNLWNNASSQPSVRELENWDNGEFVNYDSHFESAETYELAKELVLRLQ